MGLFKRKPKPVILKSKSSFEKKKVLGIGLIVIALAITFIVMPMMSKAGGKTETIALAKSDIKKGSVITENEIYFSEKGVYGLDGYITDKQELIGKPAAVDILKNDLVTKNKVGKENITRLQAIVNGKKGLTTITVKSNAAGLASHLKSGDKVRIYNTIEDDYGGNIIVQNQLLEKLEVYDIENSVTESVESKNAKNSASGTEMVAATITFVTSSKEEEKALLEAEYNGSIHVVFVER